MLLSNSVVRAQTCLGLPSFASGKAHVNASVESADSASAFAVGLGAGTHNSLFATIGAGSVKYEGMDTKSKFGFLEFGYQLPISKFQFCPVAGGTFGTGPDDDFIKVTSRSAAFGLAAGTRLDLSGFALIPNAAIRYSYFSDKVEEEGIGTETETSNETVADLGLSFVFKSRVAVQPIIHVPISGGSSSLGLFLSIGI